LRVVGVMMSSSRIIKGVGREDQFFPEFAFETLHEERLAQQFVAEDGFQPLFMGNPSPVAESVQAEMSLQSGELELVGDNSGPSAEKLPLLLQEAHDKGFADGRREAEESLNGVCRSLSAAIESINELRARIIRESEDDLLRLAMMVAKQIIRQELSQDRKILARFVCEATTGINGQNDIVICFHPEDYLAVSANRQHYLAGIDDKMQVCIKSDDSVSVGGCVVETPTGQIDARVETQLAEIFKRLMQERGHGGDGSLELPTEAELYLAEQCGAEKNGYQRD